MNFLRIPNKKGDKIIFYHDYGRGPGQRPSTGIFIYKRPKSQIEKNHNKEALALIELKKSQLTIERQVVGTGFIPTHKFKANFVEYYEQYVRLNKRNGNRHLQNSLKHFKAVLQHHLGSSPDVASPFDQNWH